LKKKLNKDRGLDALLECFSAKLRLDGFKFKTEKTNSKLKITISSCPWHNIMIKSNRTSLSERVGSRICNTEYSIWAHEFGDDIKFNLEDKICRGSSFCILTFKTG
jgi:hypothetical protein